MVGIDARSVRQLLKEFWIPSLLAVAWTAVRLWQQGQPVSITDLIATFGPAFFLVSWATGQIVRIRRQARVEDSFTSVEMRLLAVTENLESTSQKVIGHVTGGESYCYFSFYSDGAPAIMAVHQGDFPLYAVHARAVDVDEFQKATAAGGSPISHDYQIEIGDLPPHTARPIPRELAQKNWRALNIFFSARNGYWSQLVRRESSSVHAPAAIRVQRNNSDGQLEIMFEQIPPSLNADKIDWS